MPTPYIHSPMRENSFVQSLTMQMALRPEGPYVRPTLEPALQTFKKVPQPILSSAASTAPVLEETNNSAKSVRSRTCVTSPPASSRSQSPATPGRQQCAGVTKAGRRCTRQVKLCTNLTQCGWSDDEFANEVFCYQHLKELMGPRGFYSRKDGAWIEFADWIPSYLQVETQVALRVEMEKARSSSDVPGYIYAFEIRDPDKTENFKLKVGRAVNLVKRLDQWEKQCGSEEQVLRGYYPGAAESDHDGTNSLMKGRLRVGEAGPWCHRMERLIHIELADLAASAVYLIPTWPKVNPQIGDSSPSVKRSTGSGQRVPCPDCGSHHKEIFEFERLTGRLKGQEWEEVIRPVIQRWGKFVGQCV
ncbi:hypothetical protein J132_06242 [Termitomyces sp. J132]|nr:hypothetical protein J132_06242 [Termitomyces sp. J132]